MCLGIPGKVIDTCREHDVLMGKVDFSGISKRVGLEQVPQVRPGGGVKRGVACGQTDEHGYEAVENRMHVYDLHAKVLHLLGLHHERLTFRYPGHDTRLTDVKGG